MDTSKAESDDPKSTTTANEENPNNNIIINSPTISPLLQPGSNVVLLLNENENEPEPEPENQNRQPSTARTPFNNLSQVDADLALARTLQNQERAYMMLRMNGDGSTYGTWAPGSYAYEEDDDFDDPSEDEYDGSDDDDNDDEDAFDVHAHAEAGEDDNPDVLLDPAAFPNDEAYARALQDAEDREVAARLLALAGMNDMVSGEDEDEDTEDHDVDSQDTWEEVDPDELSYEELLALGEVVGTESRGLSAESIASLSSMKYKPQSSQAESSDPCVICRLDYEDGDTLTVLACKHSYHSECINNWLQINKVCPVCSTEVSTSGNS